MILTFPRIAVKFKFSDYKVNGSLCSFGTDRSCCKLKNTPATLLAIAQQILRVR